MARCLGFNAVLSPALAALFVLSCQSSAPSPSTRPLTDSHAPAGYPDQFVTELAPADNPLTEPRAELGRRLFYEPRLSQSSTVACSNCHRPEHAFSDSSALSTGVGGRVGTRNAPALVNRAWSTSFFWDGRGTTLEEVVTQPIENPAELALPLVDAVARLTDDASYVRDFADAFSGASPSAVTLAQALASFVRTLVSGNSPYDQHLRGDDSAFPPAAQRGEALFFSSKAGCFRCHPRGPLSNGGYFNNGSYVAGGDTGRQALSGLRGDLGKFKVPPLRNVAASAPYMHDGSVLTLRDVIDQYARGGRGDPSTDPLITPLSLSENDKLDLLAFLATLTDEEFLRDPRFTP